jgi:hypothetical protein
MQWWQLIHWRFVLAILAVPVVWVLGFTAGLKWAAYMEAMDRRKLPEGMLEDYETPRLRLVRKESTGRKG